MSHEKRYSVDCWHCSGGAIDPREWDGDPCPECKGRGKITRRRDAFAARFWGNFNDLQREDVRSWFGRRINGSRFPKSVTGRRLKGKRNAR